MDDERKKLIKKKRRDESVSFSASLPEDVDGVFAESDCVVKYSSHPCFEIRKSILEMIRYTKSARVEPRLLLCTDDEASSDCKVSAKVIKHYKVDQHQMFNLMSLVKVPGVEV
ncbi:hypothetical protein Ccrd_017149 [Cynara cardunculus var. scolymus]|uniref:Uncharacterized protein n=1 Tax=Cynara cardunculus var. scolymus TaxID=59895 RepID=A0A103Y8M2_CYNCS|nr:hypothetical protein Ccrd_017149 [Cynara cardunculus var. scolymus]